VLKYQSKNFAKSAYYALNGLRLAFKSQRNFKKHILIFTTSLVVAFFLKLDLISLCLIILANSIALSLELLNSAIEFILDAYYKNKWAKLAKLAKDMSAGAVLISSCAAFGITLLLCLNKIYLLYF